ncbi:MAG: hypothetical protein Kow0032_07370 [Methyloligellaceae bacterium]
MPEQTMMLPALSREVEVRADTADQEARTVEVVWTTGARVLRRRYWDEDFEEELSLDDGAVRLERLNSGAPFLNTHGTWDLSDIIGVVVDGSARIENGQGVATIRFSDREDVEPIWRDVLNKIVRNVSVGYRVHKWEIEKRESGPEIWRAVDWEPLEISAVPVGADPGAHVRSEAGNTLEPCVVVRRDNPAASPAAQQQRSAMPEETKPVAGGEGGKSEVASAPANPGGAEQRSEPAAPAAPQQQKQPNADEVRADERARISGIQALGDKFGLERSFTDDLIKRDVSLAEARSAVLDKLAEADERGAGHTQISMPAGGLDATETRREAISEALLHRVQPQQFEMTDRAREYRGMRLIDVARDCLEAAGQRTRGMTPGEMAYAATRSAGLHSSSDFPLILAAVAGKRLRGAYAGTPRTFQRWARGVTATDFKPMYPTQVGNFPALKPVMEGAEFSYGSISEGRESYQLATYGRIVALTRQAIINDDMRAFDRAIASAGQRAADLESAIVYNVLIANAALADGVALFHGDHNNLGNASVIDEDALSAALEAMTQQKDLDGEEYIDARPRFILVPPGQRSIEARKSIAATTPAKSDDVNPFTGSFEIVEEPRLFVTGGPQPWFLAADPNLVDTVEYAHLEGQMEPFMDQRAGFEVDGVEFKIRHDFAAKALEYRGLYKNAGANPA